MKPKLLASLALACACASSAFAETYNLVGDRYLRRYTADTATPVYNASVDAALIADDLCKVPWVHSDVTQAVYTTHTESLLNSNVVNREQFDAASFCAGHTNATHTAYANAAVYRYELPDGTLPSLTNLSVRVFSDPYNRYGARIVLMTNSTGEIPTDCATVRGNVEGSIRATNVAHRISRLVNGSVNWFPNYTNLVFSTAQLGASGLQLQKYLFVFVLMENYTYVNGNWIEGSSYIRNRIEIQTSAAVPTWTDGATINLSVVSAPSSDDGETSDDDTSSSLLDEERDLNDVTEATQSPWYGKMACYEEDMTVVKCVAGSVTNYFAAPAVAYRRLHRGETDLSSVTHAAFKYGTGWALGPSTNLSASSGLAISAVYPHRAVKLLHRAARDSRGYEYLPTLVDMTNSDVRLVTDYAAAFGLGASYFATVTNLAATTRIPLGWILYTGVTSTADTDGDTLDLVHEWDNGIYPTNPNAKDTDGDTIRDDYELAFYLKGPDSGEDFDGDGLSNYAEYLVSNVFRFAACDPANPATGGVIRDYYKKVGSVYLGEMFQDHDRVSDAWEQTYPSFANASVYDPARDDDEDGWSNFAEAKAGTNPARAYSQSLDATRVAEYPVPIIRAKVNYAGTIVGQMNFRAWSEKYDPKMVRTPDAAWSSAVSTNTVKYVGLNPGKTTVYRLGTGPIQRGTVKIYFRDVNCQDVQLYNGEVVSSVISTRNAMWYYFVEDRSDGYLYTCVSTNSSSANVGGSYKVGTVDYDTGLVTVEYDKLPEYSYDQWANGEGSTDGKSQGVLYNAVRVNIADSYIRIAYTPAATVSSGNQTFYLSDSIGPAELNDDNNAVCTGHVREGLNSFFVWCDLAGGTAGVFDPGEPFGYARNVDVGWQGAEFEVTISRMSAITPRFRIWESSESNDRGVTVSETVSHMLTDRIRQTTNPKSTNLVETANAANERVHVRIVRFGVNDVYAYACGVGYGAGTTGSPDPIVLDRTYEKSGRKFICEADFLQDGEFDLDWSRLKNEVVDNGDVDVAAGDVTNVTYLAVLDGGKGHEYWIEGNSDTNTVIRALGTPIIRRFERVKHAPVAENVKTINAAARPTFRWSLPNEESGAKAYGTTYTAFKIKVFDANGAKVWDSGLHRAPAQRADGAFEWMADVSVGDLISAGNVVPPTGNFTWQVAMYNAKFVPWQNQAVNAEAIREDPSIEAELEKKLWLTEDVPSEAASFSMAVNATHEMNDSGYSSIDVAVRYAGPSEVLAHYADVATLAGKVRVQAFATGDFAGVPLAEAVVTNRVDAFADPSANVRLVGLPASGTYYLRAYVDSNGNHALDDWESWGAADDPVTLTTATATAPVTGVWIEDSDTDQDWYPDGWEYVTAGSSMQTAGTFLNRLGPSIDKSFHVNQALYNSVSSSTLGAGVSTYAPGVSLTAFQRTAATNAVYGIGTRTLPSVETIRNVVRGRLNQ